MHLVLSFVAGILAAVGVPYFIKGITGEKHSTPFGPKSNPVVNVIWGALCLGLAWFLWRYAGHNTGHAYRYIAAFGVGALAMSMLLAKTFPSKK